MAKLIYENRFLLTRKLHKEYYRAQYMKMRFRRLFYFGYRFREWINYRELQAQHDKAIVNLVRFQSDNVHVKVNQTAFSFHYDTIVGAEETEELIVLKLRKEGMAEHVQLLWKNGFVGKPPLEEFKAYINKRTGKSIFVLEEAAEES